MKVKKEIELLETIYDTLAGNNQYEQFNSENVEDCGFDYIGNKMVFLMKNGYRITLDCTVDRTKFLVD